MAKNLGGDLPYRTSLIGEPFDLSSLRGRRLRTWSSSSHTLTYRLEPAQRGETARFPLAGAIRSRCLVSKLARKTAADFADASEVVARGTGVSSPRWRPLIPCQWQPSAAEAAGAFTWGMVVFALIGLVGLGAALFLPATLDVPRA